LDRIILHSDANNFYASVECLYHPELRGKPVAVGGDVEQRHGIVLAKNYIAKGFGVQTGEALWQAKQKCPDIIFMKPDFQKYIRFSKMAQEIYSEYTDKIESFGLDESWMDVTASTHLFGDGVKIANEIRERVKFELGITVSVGVSFNKIFAKLGSDMKKPDETTEITRENFKDVVWKLPVKELLYVGRATQNKFRIYGIKTIGDLAQADVYMLKYLLGVNGQMLWLFANGLDTSPVSNIGAKSFIKSIGNSTTTPRDLITDTDVKITLYVLCESVAERLREHNFVCSTVQISIRDNELSCYERQGKLVMPSCTSQMIFEKAFELYKANVPGKPIRTLGVRACQLSLRETEQLSFLPEIEHMQKRETVECAIDEIRRRFGHYSIRRGIMLMDNQLSNLDPKSDHTIHPVSFLK